MKIVRNAQELVDAIGARPGDTIRITGSQHERPKNWEPPKSAPTTPDEWDALRYCTREELLALGCGNWDDSGLIRRHHRPGPRPGCRPRPRGLAERFVLLGADGRETQP